LVIDDEPINADIAKDIVSDFGLEVFAAGSADIALELCFKFLAQQKKIDLIFLDYNMPDVYGDELATILRQSRFEPILKDTPIVGLTAHTDAETKRLCLAAGMNRVESKPFNVNKIKEILNDFNLIDE
jgi:CheY-like chemotaxis protein